MSPLGVPLAVLLLFGLTLLGAVLLSGLAQRTILSNSVLFLIMGFIAGPTLHLFDISVDDTNVRRFVEAALVATLFVGGLDISVGRLKDPLPARALFIALPVTMLGVAVAGRLAIHGSWLALFLLGAIIGPTDPILASAIVTNPKVPERLRHFLNVESGLNDGIALPFVVILIEVLSSDPSSGLLELMKVLLAIPLGVAIAVAASLARRIPYLSGTGVYEPLHGLSIGLLIFAACAVTGLNAFLAAFTGGVALAAVSPHVTSAFRPVANPLTELVKLAAVFVFGALLTTHLLAVAWPAGYIVGLLALFVVRPVAIAISLVGVHPPLKLFAVAAWFGPKGFSSVLYGLLVVSSAVPERQEIFAVVAVVVAMSIILHSSSDMLAVHWLIPAKRADEAADPAHSTADSNATAQSATPH